MQRLTADNVLSKLAELAEISVLYFFTKTFFLLSNSGCQCEDEEGDSLDAAVFPVIL